MSKYVDIDYGWPLRATIHQRGIQFHVNSYKYNMPKWIDPLMKFNCSNDILSQFGTRCRLY